MRVVALDTTKPWPDNIRVVDLPDPPPPKAGQVLVAIDAFPINPADLLLVHGRHTQHRAISNAPTGDICNLAERNLRLMGAEGAARVIAVGPDVKDLSPGQRVVLLGRSNWMERALVPRGELVAVSDDMDPMQHAMLKINPFTAYLLLHGERVLKAGDWFAQTAANSSVGRMAIRIARREGFRSVNIVRQQSAIKACEDAGGDIVIVDGPDLCERVAEATGGAPIVLGLDAVGGTTAGRLARCLAEGAPLLLYGFLGGDEVHLDSADVVFRGIRLKGFQRGRHLPADPAELKALFKTIAGLVNDGCAASTVEAIYGMEEIHRAIEHAERASRSGRILVKTSSHGL